MHGSAIKPTQRAPFTVTIDVPTRCNRGIVVVSMKVWVDQMDGRDTPLSTFNMLTFKSETHLMLWVSFWEEYGEAFFSDLSKQGCKRVTFNRVWNKKRQYKASSLFECKNPEAFKACQKVIEAWSKRPEWQELMKSEAMLEATRNIVLQDHRAN